MSIFFSSRELRESKCFLGVIKRWMGALGLISLKTATSSSSYRISAGSSWATMWQNMQVIHSLQGKQSVSEKTSIKKDSFFYHNKSRKAIFFHILPIGFMPCPLRLEPCPLMFELTTPPKNAKKNLAPVAQLDRAT